MGRYLVTGGAGFVGSHVVDRLVDAGHDVVVVDSLDPSAHDGPPRHLRDDVVHRWGDLADPLTYGEGLVDGLDGVSHQAGKVGLGQGAADAPDYVRANDLGTAELLAALAGAGFDGRFALASSMVVYGEGRYRCDEHGVVRPGPRRVDDLEAGRYEPPCPVCAAPLSPEAVPESARTDPRNVYAATKAHQEDLCRVLARQTGAVVTALRYHNVFGPRMPRDTPYAGVASLFRSALERGEPPRVLEDGAQLRDFVHVDDVARANVLALTGEAAVDEAVNIASGAPRSVGDMAAELAAAFGGPAPEVVGGYRLGDVRHVFASTERAARALGFRAEIPFDEGMRAFARAELRGTPS